MTITSRVMIPIPGRLPWTIVDHYETIVYIRCCYIGRLNDVVRTIDIWRTNDLNICVSNSGQFTNESCHILIYISCQNSLN